MDEVIKILNDIYGCLAPITALFTILFMVLIGYLAFKFLDKFELVKKEKNKDE